MEQLIIYILMNVNVFGLQLVRKGQGTKSSLLVGALISRTRSSNIKGGLTVIAQPCAIGPYWVPI